MKEQKPCKIVAFYDSETTNLPRYDGVRAFPIVHQLGVYKGQSLKDITPENVKEFVPVSIFRHTFEVCDAMEHLKEEFSDVVPVVCIHNLGFDMWPLSDWISSHDCKVLAKTSQKPISFTFLDEEGNSELVLWDTLGFSMRSLAKMGDDCGLPKLKGAWDYNLVRTPKTPLTDEETAYAKHDIWALAAWLGWFLRRNPDIEESKLALNIVTKTGVVREKRVKLFDKVRGKRNKQQNVGRYWYYHNKQELPKTDDELRHMHACTRGGFTFTASKLAGMPFELEDTDKAVFGFDAKSQHPAQMVSRLYPRRFEELKQETLQKMAQLVMLRSFEHVLKNWVNPFSVAFNACFEFENVSLKQDTLYSQFGIATLASARFAKTYAPIENSENEANDLFKKQLFESGYKDTCEGGVFEFGKLVKADKMRVFLTEIELWITSRVYDFESVKALSGYGTTSFTKPTDLSVLSVMEFYRAKDVFKKHMRAYQEGEILPEIEELRRFAPDSMVDAMKDGTADVIDLQTYYTMNVKSSLNSLYGIECTNEARADSILTAEGIAITGDLSIENLPKNPKSWYQFGQRVVGYSRLSQIVHMELAYPYVEYIINGDTDSLKILARIEALKNIEKEFSKVAKTINAAQKTVCKRVEVNYPNYYYYMKDIGRYEKEFETSFYYAAWNKAYALMEHGSIDIVFAGITVNARPKSLREFAQKLLENGETFSSVCETIFGYNVSFDNSITKQNMRTAPEWASVFLDDVTDYKGDTCRVCEGAALALSPMVKVTGDTMKAENAANFTISKANNPRITDKARLLCWFDKPEVMNL